MLCNYADWIPFYQKDNLQKLLKNILFPEEIIVLYLEFIVLFYFYELEDYLPIVTTSTTQKVIKHLLIG